MRYLALIPLLVLSAPAFAADLSGEYTGTSTTDDGAYTSKIRLVFKKTADVWDCKFTFNLDGEDVPTKTVSCKVDDAKLSAEYEAEVNGAPMHILIEGDAKEDKSLAGKFKTVAPSGGDAIAQGTWKASVQQ